LSLILLAGLVNSEPLTPMVSVSVWFDAISAGYPLNNDDTNWLNHCFWREKGANLLLNMKSKCPENHQNSANDNYQHCMTFMS